MTEFGTLNLEEVAGEDARLNNESGNFLDQFIPMPDVKPGQTGSIALRILPPVKGGKLFQFTRMHVINGRKVHCPRPLTKDGKWDRNVYCPICDYYSSLWRKIDKIEEEHGKDCPQSKDLKEEARGLKPIERYYYNAIARKLVVDGTEKTNVGPRILSVGKILHKMIVRAIVGDESEPALGDITNIKTGYDFIIRKEQVGEYPKYDRSSFAREPSVAGSAEEIKTWVNELHDLTKLRTLKEDAVLDKELAIHRGLIPDDTESFDVDKFDSKFKKNGQPVKEEAPVATAPVTEAPTSAVVTVNEDGTMTGTDDDQVDQELMKELSELQ